MSEIHEDRRRAESFGADAERYDRTRPSYPAALVDWLTSEGPGVAVDVGCGTGQLTRLLVAAGWDVVGVEADPRMAAVARGHGVRVEVTSFERWSGGEGRFDLVCSAQAWHWIDPAVGYARAARVLRPGGRLALMWNSYHYDPAVVDVFEEVVGRRVPSLLEDSVPLGTVRPDYDAHDAQAIARLGEAFVDVETQVFAHQRTQTVDSWLDEALTHSPIGLLPADERDPLLGELRERLTSTTGGQLRVGYEARATAARRR